MMEAALLPNMFKRYNRELSLQYALNLITCYGNLLTTEEPGRKGYANDYESTKFRLKWHIGSKNSICPRGLFTSSTTKYTTGVNSGHGPKTRPIDLYLATAAISESQIFPSRCYQIGRAPC